MSANPAFKRRLRAAAVVIALAAGISPAGAISDVYVSDTFTGIAIGGYDPVAYFVEGKPVAGKREIEVEWDGAFWRFMSEGNAAAFLDAPTVYAPAFGGHGVVGVARGQPQRGEPTIYVIHGGRLYFFYSEADRQQFLGDPDSLLAAAADRWADVLAQLAR